MRLRPLGEQTEAAMQKVARPADLQSDRGLRVQIGEEKVLLVRDGDAVRAYSALAPTRRVRWKKALYATVVAHAQRSSR
jgi:nitrite reductase/ring-hydroxylating ferredoxin subunit